MAEGSVHNARDSSEAAMKIPIRMLMSVELNSGGYRMPQYFEFAVPVGPHRTAGAPGAPKFLFPSSAVVAGAQALCLHFLTSGPQHACFLLQVLHSLAARHNYTCTFTLSEALSSSGFDSGVVLSSRTRQQQHCLFQYTVTNKAACKTGHK